MGGAIWVFGRPTTLIVHAVLVEDGVDVTDHVALFVGPINEGADLQALSLGDLDLLAPQEGTTNQFTVVGDKPIGLLIANQGQLLATDMITLPRGADETHQIVLDAGLVNLTANR